MCVRSRLTAYVVNRMVTNMAYDVIQSPARAPDERPPYRAVIADGAADLAPLETTADPTAGMAVRYLGRVGGDAYDKLTADTYQQRGQTLLALRPESLRGFDNSYALGRAELAFVRLRDRLPIPRRWL
jgi:hypothetical protein